VRVKSGRRFVEEDHRRAADQARGQVKPSAHTAGVGADPPSAGVGQLELRQQLRRPLPGRRPRQPRQPAHHPQVFLAGLRLVQHGELAGQADPAADLAAVADDVETGHPGLSAVGPAQRGQDAHRGRLAGAVGITPCAPVTGSLSVASPDRRPRRCFSYVRPVVGVPLMLSRSRCRARASRASAYILAGAGLPAKSVNENWFAPQPTANMANAIRTQARALGCDVCRRAIPAVAIMILTIIR
jgi:hypothetical protein